MLLHNAWFNGVNYATAEAVEVDLLENEFGDKYIPHMGEYFIYDGDMYKITHVFWDRDAHVVRIKGHVVVLCYVLSLRKEPAFEGSIDECAEWLGKNPDHQGMVYVEGPFNETMTIPWFLSGRWT